RSCTSWKVMWRASFLGCTVMPGAPACTHTSAAATTDGITPPRALRTVATLLMLTESLIMTVLGAAPVTSRTRHKAQSTARSTAPGTQHPAPGTATQVQSLHYRLSPEPSG